MDEGSLGAGIFLGLFWGFGPLGLILVLVLGKPRLKKGFLIGSLITLGIVIISLLVVFGIVIPRLNG